MNRVRILTVFLALIALTSALAACGGGSSDSPQSIVDEATLQGIESGEIDLALGIGAKGEKSGHVDVSLSGPFQSESEAELPELDLSATAKGSIGGEDVDFNGGFTLLGGNKAYVGYEGAEYEVDPTTFSFVKSAIKKQGGGQSSEASACTDAAGELKISDFMENLEEGGSADVGGTSTSKVSGDLNAAAALDTVSELIEDPACSEQLKAAGPLPSAAELDAAKGMVQDSVKDAHVDLYVGDDHIVRRISAQATIEPPAGSAGKGASSVVTLDLDLKLSGVNEDQTISAPQSSKPLSDLFLKLGINPLELLGAFEGQGAAGLGGLLEGLNGIGGSSSGGGGGGSSGGGQQDYLECLQGAHTATAIQNCVGMLQ